MSPDGKRGIFIREWNLWVHDVATRQERQLTTDGAKYFGYATDNAGWTSSDRAIALWSADSKKVATQQQDEREVGELYFVPTVPGHPTLRVSKYPLPGDKVMAMLHRVVIDVDSGKIVRLQMEPDFHRGTLSDNINVRDYSWSPDGTKLALASVSRDHKAGVAARRGHGDRRRSNGARRENGDAVPITNRMAGAVADQRSDLVLGAH